MVNLFKRMRKLKTILGIKLGTGAAIFPSLTTATRDYPAVTRLHLTYARKIYGGHQGARHFWRHCLPRLKYHNPSIPMTVQQTSEQDEPPALTIYFAERVGAAASAIAGQKQVEDKHAPTPGENEQIAVVNVKGLNYREIWSRVQTSTGAKEVEAGSEDVQDLERLKKISEKAVVDRQRIEAMRQAKRDQERMLAEARGEIEKAKQI